MPSRARWSVAAVDEELPVDGVADPSLEGPHRFFAAVAFGLHAQVVRAAGGVVAHLGHGDDVDGVVELAVAARVEPVANDRSARGFDRGGGVVAGVVPGAREACDVAAVAEDVRGDDRAGPVQLGDRGA